MTKGVPRGLYGSEAELCEEFIHHAKQAGYAVHRELSAWDLMLVDGDLQIGVQAKLKPNTAVLDQALASEIWPGPDVHAVLVPSAQSDFLRVARELRIVVLQGGRLKSESLRGRFERAPRWRHAGKHWIPEVEIETAAGVPAPRRITPWKVAAVKLCLRARATGHVTPADMRELKLNRAWWVDRHSGPVLVSHERGKYVLRDPLDLRVPDLRWPEIVRALQLTDKPRATPRVRTRKCS